MFLIPLLTAAGLLVIGAGITIYILEVKYLPQLGLSLHELHVTLEQYETVFQDLEHFVWIYIGAVGAALFLTIIITNLCLTHTLFRHISEPLSVLVAGVERIQAGDLDSPIQYSARDEFKAPCDAIDLMAAKLKAALEEEQRSAQARKEMIAEISHDLKSPLTSIRAYSEAIRDGVAASPEAIAKYIDTVCRKEQEIEDMVNNLFEFSKLDMNELPLNMCRLELKTEIEAAAADRTQKASISTERISLRPVMADRTQLHRIVQNIIDNSIKYSGRARVNIVIHDEDWGEFVKLYFDDDGQGIADGRYEKLFDLFYRADPSRDRSKDGSGIGLAVVKKAAEQMGGSVTACKSGLGGLCIVISLRKADLK